jgi:3',5'-cyclic AMP phosphodiesterase CpdA
LILSGRKRRLRFISEGDDYSFIVATDIHIQNGETYGFEGLKSVIDDPANNIKFLVVLGDITQNGSRSDLKLFIDIVVNQFGVPCYPVIGNHDLYVRVNGDNIRYEYKRL